MQGTQVRSLLREDPTCRRATKPERHNYWAHVPQLLKPTHPKARALQQEKPPQWEACTKSSPCSPQLEKAHVQQRRPNATKNK